MMMIIETIVMQMQKKIPLISSVFASFRSMSSKQTDAISLTWEGHLISQSDIDLGAFWKRSSKRTVTALSPKYSTVSKL